MDSNGRRSVRRRLRLASRNLRFDRGARREKVSRRGSYKMLAAARATTHFSSLAIQGRVRRGLRASRNGAEAEPLTDVRGSDQKSFRAALLRALCRLLACGG